MKIQIGYGQIDPSAKPDSHPEAEDRQPWTNLQDLKFDNIKVANVATCEHNQAILDGAQTHLPNKPEGLQWGLWSLNMSDENGKFDFPPGLEINFDFNHKSPGLTLLFYPHSEDWASLVKVTWFSSDGMVIVSNEYTINSVIGEITEKVSNFRKIKIEFLKTNIRNRYIKLAGIDYGKGRSFPDDAIDSCQILEEVDPTSTVVSINTLRFRIRTTSPEFSMVSGVGDNMLMRNQAMNVVADNKRFGAFFLKLPWKDVYGDGTVIDFEADDIVGAMENYQFVGDVYENIPFKTLVQMIFDVCFPTKLVGYEIEPDLAKKTVSGHIPAGTCRQALQLAAFAIGAIVDDSRRDYVWIYPRETDLQTLIEENMIYLGAQIMPTKYISGIDLVAHQFSKGEDEQEAFKGELEAGQHTLKFNAPVHSLSIAGGRIKQSGANHAAIEVEEAGEVIVTGKRYIASSQLFSIRREVDSGEIENILVFDKCTVLSPKNAPGVLENLFLYYGQRAEVDVNVRLEDLECGYIVQVPTRAGHLPGNPIKGTIEQLDINLRAGSARMKVKGNVDSSRDRSNTN